MCADSAESMHGLLVIGCFADLGLKSWFEDDDSCHAADPVQHSSQYLYEGEPYSQLTPSVNNGERQSMRVHPSEDDLNQCR